MKQEELMLSLAKLIFPSELLDHFSLVYITETPTDVVFHLEECDVLQNPLPGHEYEKNGFYEAARINGFPISKNPKYAPVISVATPEPTNDRFIG